ncbi:MAG: phosphoribosylglycinamide formyltransferase [Chloroflexota bacterium]|nr:phosphoribosylglycinamide formyltransferase [Chloroflexota bacterium]
MVTLRLGVLASGRGTSLQAILDASATGSLPAQVVVVLGNRPRARALERSRAAGVPTFSLPQGRFPTRRERDLAMVERLRQHDVGLVVMAGYDRVLAPEFLHAFPQRVINLHPSLLPAFGGELAVAPRPQAAALDYGCKLAGCTVQFVVDDGGIDSGPIIAQGAVAIYDDDTVDTLVARLLREEHRILLDAIRWIASGGVRLAGRRVLTGHLRSPDEPAPPV